MGAELAALVDDLVAESAALRGLLDQLGPAEWGLSTAATGWCLCDHVSQLAYFDETTLESLVDPDQFRRNAELLTAGDDFPDCIAAEHRLRSGADLLGWFRDARAALVSAYRGVDPLRRLPWYGPDMSPASSITARLMETWAHGQDIVDASAWSVRRAAAYVTSPIWASAPCRTASPSITSRLPWSRSGCSCGCRTGTYGPGDPSTPSTVSPATPWVDFCLVVTQRRHRDDTGVVVTGPTAQQWIALAQAFAGSARPGRRPQLPSASTARSERCREVERDFV
jgi:uncharacterized protein (TIGR03083 family)